MTRFKYLISSAFLTCSFYASSSSAATFLESDGILIMEAESSPAAGDWGLETSIGGYAGSGYLVWNGADAFGVESAGRGTVTYTFKIEKAGNYELQWRSRITRGNNSTEHNDSWVRFPSGQNISGEEALSGWTKVFMSTLGRWAWQSATVDHVGRRVRQYFSAGEHTLQISGRSNGHAIDRISLYHYNDVAFSESLFDSLGQSGTTDGSTPEAEPDAPQPPAGDDAPADDDVEPAEDPADNPAEESQPEPEPEPSNIDAPVLSVSGDLLTWSSVEAIAYNVHTGDGAWIETLPNTQTQWRAPAAGTYYIVATGEGTWETWGRSETVTVESVQSPESNPPTPDGSSLNLSAQVYSSSAIELFWNADDLANLSFEIYRDEELQTISDGRSFFEEGLNPGTSYGYEVLSIDSAGEVVESASISISTFEDANAAVDASDAGDAAGDASLDAESLSLRAEVYSQSVVELFWEFDGPEGSEVYEFDVSLEGRLLDTTDARSFLAQGLTAGGVYNFKVSVLAGGSVIASDTATVQTYPADMQ